MCVDKVFGKRVLLQFYLFLLFVFQLIRGVGRREGWQKNIICVNNQKFVRERFFSVRMHFGCAAMATPTLGCLPYEKVIGKMVRVSNKAFPPPPNALLTSWP